MLVCECGRGMHTEGLAESEDNDKELWLVRSQCSGCRRQVGLQAAPEEARAFVDRLIWSDEARHRLARMPPYVQMLMKPDVEEYARSREHVVITRSLFEQARRGGAVTWSLEAERRLTNVPAAVRAMARLELERAALECGQVEVTVALMDEVKARYFGMAMNKGPRSDE